jgi:tRNA threonylcarbamoyladenosine biosynthesis protein TsaE
MVRKVTFDYKGSKKEYEVNDLSDWEKVAEFLISEMNSGMLITLKGDLGAGKTTLTQYIAKQLGVSQRALSPTFALIKSYVVPRTSYKISRLVHVDAYRIEDESELLALDLDEELIEPGTVMIIEWPEKISNWVSKHLEKIEVSIELIA